MHEYNIRSVRWFGIAIALLCTTACGDRGPQLAPVTGTVTYKGKPVKTGRILFESVDGRSARGEIVDGKIINVTTYDKDDGAIVGDHSIVIHSFVREPKGMEIVPSAIPEKYNDLSTSDLTVTIMAGETNELTLELTD
jgi:hypothetical protein